MSESLRMILVLSLICSFSGFSLATLKQITAPRIEEQKLIFVQGPALKQIFPDADNDPVKDRKIFALEESSAVTLFPAYKNGTLTGIAFESFGEGFGGELGVMVGMNIQEGKLAGIGITSMKETPGLGTRVAEQTFTSQFQGNSLARLALRSQGGNIDAISGASVSSGAVLSAVNNAMSTYQKLKEQILAAWPAS